MNYIMELATCGLMIAFALIAGVVAEWWIDTRDDFFAVGLGIVAFALALYPPVAIILLDTVGGQAKMILSIALAVVCAAAWRTAYRNRSRFRRPPEPPAPPPPSNYVPSSQTRTYRSQRRWL